MESKEIIERIHRQWLITKEQRRQKCEARNMDEVARKLAACDLFKGTEDIPELARLFTSPQGLEFCLAANFPNLGTFRLFKPFKPERYDFYIDAGDITLHNPKTAVFIGRTTATIHCNKCQSSTIVTMHGATATVLASGWAVVRIEAGPETTVVRRNSDNAIIL